MESVASELGLTVVRRDGLLPRATTALPPLEIFASAQWVDYHACWQAMQRYTATRTEDSADQLWQVTHPPIFTLGVGADPRHVLDAGQIPVVAIDRGGEVTYHGPGQVIVYTLVDLRRARVYVRQWVAALEAATIEFLAQSQISAVRRTGAPGVYLAEGKQVGAKIAALGLKLKQKGAYHGIALNIAMDLAPFQRIHPCGIEQLSVTDMQTALAQTLDFSALARAYTEAIAQQWMALQAT